MKILFTGASSFTGYWFARQLAAAGHDLTATFTAGSAETYAGIRLTRLTQLPEGIQKRFDCPFGGDTMLSLLKAEKWDMLCHHGALVGTGYKSGEFDYRQALESNTRNIDAVLGAFGLAGGQSVLLTGSYFEADEGGEPQANAVSPYGLSKTLTWQVFRYQCAIHGVKLGKFVIPNPFGPLEEGRLTNYLAKCWLSGTEPVLKTPDYIRDYIPSDLLALSYASFATALSESREPLLRCAPTCWVETNLAFARRMADNLFQQLNVPCPVGTAKQTDFSEPLKRRNDTPLPLTGWDEKRFWNSLADYYLRTSRTWTRSA